MNQIEKVARAIAVAAGENPDENSGLLLRPHFVRWQEYEAQAEAAIEAMREPTQQMRLAGIAEWSRPDPTPEHESTLVFNAVWRAMIDAALTHS